MAREMKEKKNGVPRPRTGDVEKDAEGQFARTGHGGGNDGVDSAAPQVVTGDEDATFDTDPDGKPLGTAKKKPGT